MKALKITFTSCVLYAGLVLLGMFGIVTSAEAAEMPNACATPPTVQDFKPYVYEDGNLHSFDYTVSTEETLLAGTVLNDRMLEHRFSTMWRDAGAGKQRVHVDVPSWYGLAGEVSILASVSVGASGCLAQQQFVVQLPPKQQKNAAEVQATAPSVPSAQEDFRSKIERKYGEIKGLELGLEAVGPVLNTFNVRDVGHGMYGMGKRMYDMKEKMFGVNVEKQMGALLVGMHDAEKKVREVRGGERFEQSQLFTSIQTWTSSGDEKECTSWPATAWILLTIITIAIVLVIIDSLPRLLAGGGMRFGIALLAMFLIMVAAWFLFDRCRDYRWFPIAITLITLFTLIAPTNLGKRGGGKKT